ncbi:MAG: L,D-transpeptidase [Oscillospiraceae bacterium]|nr:L,D-transpeptidase [Oscillospiraceae bacterium]
MRRAIAAAALLLAALILLACAGCSFRTDLSLHGSPEDHRPAPAEEGKTPAAPETETPEPADGTEDDDQEMVAPEEQEAAQHSASTGNAVRTDGAYYIKVNCRMNTVTVYGRDGAGEYTEPVRAMICSTGPDTPQEGVYDIASMKSWDWLSLFGNVYGCYVTQIDGNILFHSVPYLTMYDRGSLEYWEYDQLGTAASMGCVRLQVADAKWIYDNRDEIAGVEFYSSDVAGPLGKPDLAPISGNRECRGWDPTDPDEANPWHAAGN